MFSLLSGLIYLFIVFEAKSSGIIDLHNNQQNLCVLVLLSILYLLYFAYFKFGDFEKIKIKHIFILLILINFLFLFVNFLTSNDLFSYIFQSRLLPIFGKNPYTIPYDSVKLTDSIYPAVKTIWSAHTALHGPFFLTIGGLINLIAKNNLFLLTLLFKLVLIGANLLSSYVIYLTTKSRKALFLYGFNPLVVFELSGNKHADSLLILFLVLSFYLLRNKPTKSVFSMFLSALIKYSSILLLPFQAVYLIKKGSIKQLFFGLLLGVVFTILVYIPFWDFRIFDYLFTYYNGQYVSPSLGILISNRFIDYRLAFQLNTLIFLVTFGVLGMKLLTTKLSFQKLLFYCYLVFWCYLLTKLSLVLAWDLTPLLALGALLFMYKKYQKYALFGFIFTCFYSLGLYYFVK